MKTGSEGNGPIYESLLSLLQGLLAQGPSSPGGGLGLLATPINLSSVSETMRLARELLSAARDTISTRHGGGGAAPPGHEDPAREYRDEASGAVAGGAGSEPGAEASPTTIPGALAQAFIGAVGQPAASFGTGPPLTVQMLDGVQVWIGLDPVADLPRGKARALLQLLVLHRHRPLSRGRLCMLLWPEADADRARNNLHVTLHRLRRALGDAVPIRSGESGYQLVTHGPVWVDTEHFVQRAQMGAIEEAQGRLQRAIGQYEGAASLYRYGLLDEDEHEPALAAEAQALQDHLNLVLERLAVLREDAGSLHGCVRASQRHLELDECNEQAHRRLMRCYARLGQPLLAEQQYRRCVDALKRQLGGTPSAETTELMRRIGRREAV